MKQKLLELSLKLGLLLFAVAIGGSFWYYTLGRKPKVVLAKAIDSKSGAPATHLVAPGEVLLLAAGKATLYDTKSGKERWSSVLEAAKPTPAPVQAPTPAPATAESLRVNNEKHDPLVQMLQARVERHTLKLEKWSAELAAKRKKLDTPLKVAALKEEEAKYQAAVNEARNEAEALRKSGAAARTGSFDAPAFSTSSLSDEDYFEHARAEVLAAGATICVAKGRTVRLLDRANGRLTKEIQLPGAYRKLMRGGDSLYLLGTAATGGTQVTRVVLTDGAATTINVATPAETAHFGSSAADANVQEQRAEFSASGAELVQLDVRLLEKKITEREAVKGDTVSDWEAADKKTTGGWASDAAVIAQAMENDAAREVNGGKEYVDESTYEVVLRRPFDSAIPDSAPVQVQGRPSVFSTTSFDLVAAGKTLIAFDHANRKLWQSTLAYPVANAGYAYGSGGGGAGTTSQPCLEDAKRLYVFDRGFLTAFDRQSGATVWRLPSVGIHKILLDQGSTFDRADVLYVASANAAAETLQYSRQAANSGAPLLFKLDANTGKILWKVEKFNDCFVSGGALYATMETRNAIDAVNAVFERSKTIAGRFKLYKLSTRDGEVQWEWFQTRTPLQIDADQRKVSLLFDDELQVLSSIAL